MPLSVLSKFLGHSDPETTLIRTGGFDHEARAAMKAENRNPGSSIHSAVSVWDGDEDIIEKLCRGYG